MGDTNRAFVTHSAIRAEFGAMFTEFAATDGPQLFYCTQGKDRGPRLRRCCYPSPVSTGRQSTPTIC
ncbi:tyrosine-protein phosphatase [Tomitella biformata]|uniref:tyrosine-protein phosphatase n=1 Tax=Tomitella biformata TaxID=630403 RepID=UPI0011DD0AC2